MYKEISDLVGKTFSEVRKAGEEAIEFIGPQSFSLHHDQDCCESVYIADICGDLSDLVGTEIIEAGESTSSNNDDAPVPPLEQSEDSYTWTFYRFRTIKGTVTVRFYGSSNGYYSETVCLHSRP
jgi:hypothetical protein